MNYCVCNIHYDVDYINSQTNTEDTLKLSHLYSDVLFTFLILKHDLKVLTPV